jgi:hypothetical protein
MRTVVVGGGAIGKRGVEDDDAVVQLVVGVCPRESTPEISMSGMFTPESQVHTLHIRGDLHQRPTETWMKG